MASIVFYDAESSRRRAGQWPAGYRYEFCGRSALLPDNTLKALEAAGAGEVVGMVGPDDQLYCVWHGEEIAAYGAIYVRSPQRSILGLADNAILIGECFTSPAHRRRGLFRLALNAVALRLRDAGFVYVEADPRNVASIGGIISAGFAVKASINAEIWFRYFVRRSGIWHRIGRERLARPAVDICQPSEASTESLAVTITSRASTSDRSRGVSDSKGS